MSEDRGMKIVIRITELNYFKILENKILSIHIVYNNIIIHV